MCKDTCAHIHKHACVCRIMWSEVGYASLVLQHRPSLERNCFTVPCSWWEELIGTLRSLAALWKAQQSSPSPAWHKSAEE